MVMMRSTTDHRGGRIMADEWWSTADRREELRRMNSDRWWSRQMNGKCSSETAKIVFAKAAKLDMKLDFVRWISCHRDGGWIESPILRASVLEKTS
nr:hypothetical protein [Tanacetum cinerariifolium]